jgi:L-galactose dehydrogenase
MEFRQLGNTDLNVSVLSFGASSLGQEFRNVDVNEALKTVHVAIDSGMNLIDTSPFYGRGMSEVLLGVAFKEIPRDKFYLCTKLGRYDLEHFDFSAKRVAESIDVSLHRMGIDHLDIALCHDIEFVPMQQIVDETIPALRKLQKAGKVRYIGISGYPLNIFPRILEQTDVDVILSYNHYHLQNTKLADLAATLNDKNIGIMNAGPFCARLLTNAPLPDWHKEPAEVKAVARKAAEHCQAQGVDIAKFALQFAVRHPGMATTIAGSASPKRVAQWAEWLDEPYDEQLVTEVQSIFEPVMNVGHAEGLPENN